MDPRIRPGAHRSEQSIENVRMGDGLRELIDRCLPPRAVMAEVGVLFGDASRIFLEHGQVDLLIAVDTWDEAYNPRWCGIDAPMREFREAFDRIILAPYRGRVWLLEEDSVAAAERVPDGMLDLVYIDAAHDYTSVCEDLRAWVPKVKPGGWVTGHDYTNIPDVARAVVEVLGVPDHIFPDYSFAIRRAS